MVISLGLKRENGGESLVLKEFVSLVSVLEFSVKPCEVLELGHVLKFL
jgi:hypothetical protein